MRKCENCGATAAVYAMDTCPGGWGGHYCLDHIPTKFQIVDIYQVRSTNQQTTRRAKNERST